MRDHPNGVASDRNEQEEVHQTMTEQNVWLVTGAGRGLGVDIAKAALARATPWWPPPATLDGITGRWVSTTTCLRLPST